jgi:hypothetical protein
MADIPVSERMTTLKVRPSLPDHRDSIFLAAGGGRALPASGSLGVGVPVKDQGRQGSCTGNGYASQYEARRAILKAGDAVAFSPAFIYYHERLREHTTATDSGASPIDGCKVLKGIGVCPESDFPYNDQVFDAAPGIVAEKDAARFRITGYSRVLTSRDLKAATLQQYPAGIGIAVYESFEHIGPDGFCPMPAAGEALLGGHWMYGNVAYQDDSSVPGGGYFTVQNSWGVGFGRNGMIFVPYAYLDNPNLCFEMRAIH